MVVINMSAITMQRNIQTRRQLFDFLQSQMQTAYRNLLDNQRLEYESSLIKSYIFEIEPLKTQGQNTLKKSIESLFSISEEKKVRLKVDEKEENGFFELNLEYYDYRLTLYLDTITNTRFWLGFSISSSQMLDRWLDAIVRTKPRFDFIWLWPSFLENIQKRGLPRGFGLDYDYRKFEDDEEKTTYLKMQIWGGNDTKRLYDLLKKNKNFKDKIVLSKVRLKEFGDGNTDGIFALQDVKYNGKFTTRGTDFSTHVNTINLVRSNYGVIIKDIENNYSLKWMESAQGGVTLEGFAIHFIPNGFELNVSQFCDRVFDGTMPFRLLGFTNSLSESLAIVEAVDLHTGGELSFEIYPDIISVYLPEETCGNTIARLYTNLQHFYNLSFTVEGDNGKLLFSDSFRESENGMVNSAGK
jgi:hypothetical protein